MTLDETFDDHDLGVEETIEEADAQMNKRNFLNALGIIEELIKNIENSGWYKEDSESEYFNFGNQLEEILYNELYKPEKEIKQIPENYAGVYFRHGVLLFELEKFDEAKIALESANKYNPIRIDILFELSEVYKMKNDWENYLKINNKCMDYAYSAKAIARCYRNFGFYYIEQENYELATALFQFSLLFEPNQENAKEELIYIIKKTGKIIEKPNMEKNIELIKSNNIQIGANKLVLNIAYHLGKAAQKINYTDIAKYYLEIVYDLTYDDEIKKEIEAL
jgi:tetratricopeptide (TPR) repeat protein